MSDMKPKIEKVKHEVKNDEDEDVVVKTGTLRFYFQNYYSLISLLNDIFLGLLYLIGSFIALFGGSAFVSNLFFVLGGVFLLLRPVIKVARNIYVYNEDEYKEMKKKTRIWEKK